MGVFAVVLVPEPDEGDGFLDRIGPLSKTHHLKYCANKSIDLMCNMKTKQTDSKRLFCSRIVNQQPSKLNELLAPAVLAPELAWLAFLLSRRSGSTSGSPPAIAAVVVIISGSSRSFATATFGAAATFRTTTCAGATRKGERIRQVPSADFSDPVAKESMDGQVARRN